MLGEKMWDYGTDKKISDIHSAHSIYMAGKKKETSTFFRCPNFQAFLLKPVKAG